MVMTLAAMMAENETNHQSMATLRTDLEQRTATIQTMTENSAAASTETTGSFDLSMSSTDAEAMVAAFASDASVRTSLQEGIASGLGIDSSMVVVTGVTVMSGRRLAASSSSGVQVAYTITVPG